MAQNRHYHSKLEEWGHSEEILGQRKTENHQDKYQILQLHVWCQKAQMTWYFILAACNILLPLGLCLQLSSIDIPWFWHLKHLGFSSAAQALCNSHSGLPCHVFPGCRSGLSLFYHKPLMKRDFWWTLSLQTVYSIFLCTPLGRFHCRIM